ncbi:MFS transporter [Pengzhenrongella frigida]|uniref:MFS transporter n=2 Tax=Pengzhenrongella frigida TaxID=1259133 RepID=A0A4Q5N683_9MICO|nr:MFS transporter [Cellulomonas sp. HLT2-17]
MFMSLLDATIVNVALPTIRTSLDASEATLSWIISGYALAFGLALIPAGRVGDRYGHKWVFFSGLALFTAASVACGLATDGTQLIVARVVQGLAAGIYLPAVTAYIQLLFTGRTRGRAFAIMGAVVGVSSALGPLIGGLLIEAFGDTNGWRLVFVVNLPIGIVALVAAAILLPTGSERQLPTGTERQLPTGTERQLPTGTERQLPTETENRRAAGGVDGLGLALLSGGLIAILVPLIEGQDQGWPAWTYVSLVGGVALIALFGAWEVAVAKRGRSPLVPPHLFSHPAFTGGVILALVYFAAFVSIFFTISILWQAGLGHTALESGIVSIPFAIGSIIGASQSGRLAAAIGRRVLVIGTAMVAVGLSALWLVLLLVTPGDVTHWDLLAPLLVAGTGSGLFIAPNAQFIIATVDRQEAGAASGVIGVMQRLGSAIGIAIIGSVFFGTLVLPTQGPPTADDLAIAFTHSATAALAVSAALAVVAFLLVFALPKRVGSGAPAGADRSGVSAR